MKYYKVLMNGCSFLGGNLKWDLPINDKPGNWHEVDGKLNQCYWGLHLTTEPVCWWVKGCQIFEAEAEGIESEQDQFGAFVCRKARLIRQLTDEDLFSLNIFSTGKHIVDKGYIIAYGDAEVTVKPTVIVKSFDKSKIIVEKKLNANSKSQNK
jgi:hypothetical protein